MTYTDLKNTYYIRLSIVFGFSWDIQPLGSIVRAHSLLFHGYADDQQHYLSIKPASASSRISSLESCISEIHNWMLSNSLKLNGEKTDFNIIGTPTQLSKLPPISLQVNKVVIQPSAHVKNLGVIIDQSMSSKKTGTQCCSFSELPSCYHRTHPKVHRL